MRTILKSAYQILFILSFFSKKTVAQQNGYDSVITEFVKLIKDNNVQALANKISYPLCREYPIPCVNSKKEFLKRYNEIFDDSLKLLIVNSNVSNDWSIMGYRGIMLLNGILWLDEDGILNSVNYQSGFEKKEWDELIQKDKARIYSGLKHYKTPILLWQTRRFKIRIDDWEKINTGILLGQQVKVNLKNLI